MATGPLPGWTWHCSLQLGWVRGDGSALRCLSFPAVSDGPRRAWRTAQGRAMLEKALIFSTLLSSCLGFALIALSQERHRDAVAGARTVSSRPQPWAFATGIGWL